MKANNDLFISIGNTMTTFAIFNKSINDKKIIKIPTKNKFKKEIFLKILNDLNVVPKKIFVCSVVNKINKRIVLFFKDKEIIFLNYHSQNIIDLSLLDNKNEIGNDIIASAIYAQSLGKNIIVASLGTATTLSKVSDGVLMGCIIMPGIQMSYDALIEGTMIPKTRVISTEKNLGKNTQDAMSIGIIKGQMIMINEFSKYFHTPDTIYIYFGGNAKYLKLHSWKYIEDIDLLGLYLFSTRS
ncbi:MAG: type III pantothenate kinase [Metamycoplasmataceae bacterium]